MDYLSMLSDIPYQTYDSDHIYRMYKAMPLMELLKEYKVVSMALSIFHDNNCERSVVMESLPGIVQIMQFVISERVGEFVKVEVLEECM